MKLNTIKKGFCILIIFILFLNSSTSFGAKSYSGNAIEKFTNRQYNLLFESNLSNISSEYGDIFSVSRKAEIFQNMSESIKKSREAVEEENRLVLTRIKDLEESKRIIEEELKEITQKIQDLFIASGQIRVDIDENRKRIEELKEKVEKNKKILLNYLEYLYKKSNTAYEKERIDIIKSIILNNEDISYTINDFYYNSIIQIAGKKLIENHMELIKELYIREIELKNKKIEYEKLKLQLRIAQKNEREKKEFRERLIEISKNTQKEYEKVIKEKIKTENKVREIAIEQEKKAEKIKEKILSENGCKFIDFSKNSKEKENLEKNNKKCFNLNKIIYLESQLGNSKEEKSNPMIWPLSPSRGISAYYRDPSYKKALGADHSAIDIRANQGTPIVAPMDGYVIYINPPTTKDYSFLALKHPSGYTTVFGHLSEVNVSQYQYVEKGEIIAKSGGEYGTNGAGFLSTGPHLHFEVFRNREYIDPLDVLDISYLKYNSLPLNPAKYKIKFLRDFKDRRGVDYGSFAKNSKVFKLEGKNEIERQKYLISKYSSGSFNNWQLWVDQALIGNIDPSVVMCIGLAESGLGRNLTTGFNVGNVGNNDRGDRRSYGSAKEGIAQIVKTLNNKFLGNINRLDLLSGAGRIISGLPSCKDSGQFCYATDPRYWHPNMITCLSHLKGEIIEDNYNFRIKK